MVFNRFVRRTSELTYGVSVRYCLVAGVHTSILQVDSEHGDRACAAAFMQLMDARRKSLICLGTSSGSSADSRREALLAGRRRQDLSQVKDSPMSHRHSKHGFRPTADG